MNRELIEAVWSRANDRCEYCHALSANAWLPFNIYHIIAEKHGGLTVGENLALSCYYCNSYKGPNIAGVDPEGNPQVAVQLFHPRHDRWQDNFEWVGPILKGKNPCGRVTISVLRINEPDAIEVRRMLIDIGEPP